MSPSTSPDIGTNRDTTRIGLRGATRLASLASGTFVISTGAYVMAGLLPAIRAELGIGIAEVGRLTFAYTLTYALWAPAAGFLTRHWDRRRTLHAGLALFVLATAWTAAAQTYEAMAAARVLAGAGAGMFTPAASAAAIAVVPREWQARAVACVVGGLATATVLAVPLGSLVGNLAGFRPVLWGVCLLGALTAAAVAALPEIRQTPVPGRRPGARREARSVALLLAVSLLVSVSDFAVYTYVSPLLSQLTGAGPGALSGLLFLYGCAGVLGNAAGGQLADRWGVRRTVVLSLSVVALSTAAMPWARSMAPVCVLIILWGISGWMVVPALQSELMNLLPDASGVVAAANSSVIYAGMATGSLLGGVVATVASLPMLGPFAAAVAGLALAAYAIPRRPSAGAAP